MFELPIACVVKSKSHKRQRAKLHFTTFPCLCVPLITQMHMKSFHR